MIWPFSWLRRQSKRWAEASVRATGPEIQQAEQEAARERLLAEARRQRAEHGDGGGR
ncbi:hypothetical protein [Micromonospora sp. 067-2]|uniref:hypothetical protein n=1 Tax=Micromonospora sp. 067-2 TaxID=2789270 RepID=UPI00397A4156